jgi:hypothetical protein
LKRKENENVHKWYTYTLLSLLWNNWYDNWSIYRLVQYKTFRI